MPIGRDPEIDYELLAELREIGHRWPQRTNDSWVLPGAGRFTDDGRLKDPVWLITQLQKHDELWDLLERTTTPEHVYEKRHTGKKHVVGRDRVDGHWVLIALAYALASKPELEHWYDMNRSSAIWEAAGFVDVPRYSIFHERMIELEQYVGGIYEASSWCWQIAMDRDSNIGRHWKFDGQAYESHSRLEHSEDCPACQAAGGNKDKMPRFIERQPLETAEELRHKEAELPVDVDDHLTSPPMTKDVDAASAAAELLGIDLEEDSVTEIQPPTLPLGVTPPAALMPDGRKAIVIQDHLYLCHDTDAGFKIYQSPSGKKIKQWTGGIAFKVSDEALGATICTIHLPADQREHPWWPELLLKGARIMKTLPENAMGDRDHATRRVKKLNTLAGIGSVIPFRKPNGKVTDRSQLRVDGRYDEYGNPTCEYCNSPGTSIGSKELGFRIRNGQAIIVFRCANPHLPECRKTQTMPCSEEWLLLGPLSREEPLYFDLRNAGKPSEKNNSQDRRRYMLAGRSAESRAKRTGIPFMDLRAGLGAFLDIYRILLRQGWLESDVKKNHWQPSRRDSGEKALKYFRRRLRNLGLLLPHGPQARKLGLAFTGEIPEGWAPIPEHKKKSNSKRGSPRGSPAAA